MTAKSNAAKTIAVLGQHVKELVGHTLDSAAYGSHGHAAGRQGAKGHRMPSSDAHRQGGAYLPQNVYTSGSGGNQQMDTADSEDYGTVDKFDD